MENNNDPGPEAHRHFAVNLNQQVWQLLAQSERTPQENDKMIHAAHASCYHWGEIGTAQHAARGEWLISHVYARLNRPDAALYYAEATLQTCLDNGIGGFDVAYAYEAMARALAASGDRSGSKKYIALAQEAGEKISDAEDKRIFLDDFKGGPWYGLR